MERNNFGNLALGVFETRQLKLHAFLNTFQTLQCTYRDFAIALCAVVATHASDRILGIAVAYARSTSNPDVLKCFCPSTATRGITPRWRSSGKFGQVINTSTETTLFACRGNNAVAAALPPGQPESPAPTATKRLEPTSFFKNVQSTVLCEAPIDPQSVIPDTQSVIPGCGGCRHVMWLVLLFDIFRVNLEIG